MGAFLRHIAGPSSAVFPLSVGADGRYLQTAAGAPFLIHGDTCWSLEVQASRAQVDTYLNDRQAKGFNAVMLELIEHRFSDQTPVWQNAEGNTPFTSMTDFSTPNNAYWGLVDYIISGILARGMVPFVNPAYLGFAGSDEGWDDEVTAETAGDLQTYGAFLANRYPHVVWVMGGDDGGDTTLRNKQWNIVTGIRSVRTTDLITGHGARTESAYTHWNGLAGFNLNNIYSGGTEYTLAATEYARSPALPCFLIEGRYDGDGTTAAIVRRQPYAAILSGCLGGHFFGNQPIWDLGSVNWSTGGVTAALASLSTTVTLQMAHWRSLFTAYAWHKLAPKTDTSLVTTSLGSGDTRVIPARASDGSFAMVFTPTVNFTVDMTAFPASVRGRWYDTTAGTYSNASGTPFANTGTQAFTAPGERVLVLDGG